MSEHMSKQEIMSAATAAAEPLRGLRVLVTAIDLEQS